MEGMDPLRIGETIKIKRIQKRITQTDLAKKLEISQTHLSNAENGRVIKFESAVKAEGYF